MTDGSGDEITLNRQRLIDMVGSFGQIHFRVYLTKLIVFLKN